MKNSSVRYYSLYFIFIALFISCDDNYYSSIPSVSVNLKINLTTDEPIFKNSTNQFLLIEARRYENDRVGYGGILLYSGSSLDDSGNTIYYAFDMACPYEADKDVKVYPMEDSFGEVVCEKCGSVYNVGFGFGNPTSGPATEPLKKYQAIKNGYDYLYITR